MDRNGLKKCLSLFIVSVIFKIRIDSLLFHSTCSLLIIKASNFHYSKLNVEKLA